MLFPGYAFQNSSNIFQHSGFLIKEQGCVPWLKRSGEYDIGGWRQSQAEFPVFCHPLAENCVLRGPKPGNVHTQCIGIAQASGWDHGEHGRHWVKGYERDVRDEGDIVIGGAMLGVSNAPPLEARTPPPWLLQGCSDTVEVNSKLQQGGYCDVITSDGFRVVRGSNKHPSKRSCTLDTALDSLEGSVHLKSLGGCSSNGLLRVCSPKASCHGRGTKKKTNSAKRAKEITPCEDAEHLALGQSFVDMVYLKKGKESFCRNPTNSSVSQLEDKAGNVQLESMQQIAETPSKLLPCCAFGKKCKKPTFFNDQKEPQHSVAVFTHHLNSYPHILEGTETLLRGCPPESISESYDRSKEAGTCACQCSTERAEFSLPSKSSKIADHSSSLKPPISLSSAVLSVPRAPSLLFDQNLLGSAMGSVSISTGLAGNSTLGGASQHDEEVSLSVSESMGVHPVVHHEESSSDLSVDTLKVIDFSDTKHVVDNMYLSDRTVSDKKQLSSSSCLNLPMNSLQEDALKCESFVDYCVGDAVDDVSPSLLSSSYKAGKLPAKMASAAALKFKEKFYFPAKGCNARSSQQLYSVVSAEESLEDANFSGLKTDSERKIHFGDRNVFEGLSNTTFSQDIGDSSLQNNTYGGAVTTDIRSDPCGTLSDSFCSFGDGYHHAFNVNMPCETVVSLPLSPSRVYPSVMVPSDSVGISCTYTASIPNSCSIPKLFVKDDSSFANGTGKTLHTADEQSANFISTKSCSHNSLVIPSQEISLRSSCFGNEEDETSSVACSCFAATINPTYTAHTLATTNVNTTTNASPSSPKEGNHEDLLMLNDEICFQNSHCYATLSPASSTSCSDVGGKTWRSVTTPPGAVETRFSPTNFKQEVLDIPSSGPFQAQAGVHLSLGTEGVSSSIDDTQPSLTRFFPTKKLRKFFGSEALKASFSDADLKELKKQWSLIRSTSSCMLSSSSQKEAPVVDDGEYLDRRAPPHLTSSVKSRCHDIGICSETHNNGESNLQLIEETLEGSKCLVFGTQQILRRGQSLQGEASTDALARCCSSFAEDLQLFQERISSPAVNCREIHDAEGCISMKMEKEEDHYNEGQKSQVTTGSPSVREKTSSANLLPDIQRLKRGCFPSLSSLVEYPVDTPFVEIPLSCGDQVHDSLFTQESASYEFSKAPLNLKICSSSAAEQFDPSLPKNLDFKSPSNMRICSPKHPSLLVEKEAQNVNPSEQFCSNLFNCSPSSSCINDPLPPHEMKFLSLYCQSSHPEVAERLNFVEDVAISGIFQNSLGGEQGDALFMDEGVCMCSRHKAYFPGYLTSLDFCASRTHLGSQAATNLNNQCSYADGNSSGMISKATAPTEREIAMITEATSHFKPTQQKKPDNLFFLAQPSLSLGELNEQLVSRFARPYATPQGTVMIEDGTESISSFNEGMPRCKSSVKMVQIQGDNNAYKNRNYSCFGRDVCCGVVNAEDLYDNYSFCASSDKSSPLEKASKFGGDFSSNTILNSIDQEGVLSSQSLVREASLIAIPNEVIGESPANTHMSDRPRFHADTRFSNDAAGSAQSQPGTHAQLATKPEMQPMMHEKPEKCTQPRMHTQFATHAYSAAHADLATHAKSATHTQPTVYMQSIPEYIYMGLHENDPHHSISTTGEEQLKGMTFQLEKSNWPVTSKVATLNKGDQFSPTFDASSSPCKRSSLSYSHHSNPLLDCCQYYPYPANPALIHADSFSLHPSMLQRDNEASLLRAPKRRACEDEMCAYGGVPSPSLNATVSLGRARDDSLSECVEPSAEDKKTAILADSGRLKLPSLSYGPLMELHGSRVGEQAGLDLKEGCLLEEMNWEEQLYPHLYLNRGYATWGGHEGGSSSTPDGCIGLPSFVVQGISDGWGLPEEYGHGVGYHVGNAFEDWNEQQSIGNFATSGVALPEGSLDLSQGALYDGNRRNLRDSTAGENFLGSANMAGNNGGLKGGAAFENSVLKWLSKEVDTGEVVREAAIDDHRVARSGDLMVSLPSNTCKDSQHIPFVTCLEESASHMFSPTQNVRSSLAFEGKEAIVHIPGIGGCCASSQQQFFTTPGKQFILKEAGEGSDAVSISLPFVVEGEGIRMYQNNPPSYYPTTSQHCQYYEEESPAVLASSAGSVSLNTRFGHQISARNASSGLLFEPRPYTHTPASPCTVTGKVMTPALHMLPPQCSSYKESENFPVASMCASHTDSIPNGARFHSNSFVFPNSLMGVAADASTGSNEVLIGGSCSRNTSSISGRNDSVNDIITPMNEPGNASLLANAMSASVSTPLEFYRNSSHHSNHSVCTPSYQPADSSVAFSQYVDPCLTQCFPLNACSTTGVVNSKSNDHTKLYGLPSSLGSLFNDTPLPVVARVSPSYPCPPTFENVKNEYHLPLVNDYHHTTFLTFGPPYPEVPSSLHVTPSAVDESLHPPRGSNVSKTANAEKKEKTPNENGSSTAVGQLSFDFYVYVCVNRSIDCIKYISSLVYGMLEGNLTPPNGVRREYSQNRWRVACGRSGKRNSFSDSKYGGSAVESFRAAVVFRSSIKGKRRN